MKFHEAFRSVHEAPEFHKVESFKCVFKASIENSLKSSLNLEVKLRTIRLICLAYISPCTLIKLVLPRHLITPTSNRVIVSFSEKL